MTEDFSYEISEDEREYYEWRNEAQRNGLLHDATLAYYLSDSKHLYTIVVDGELETAPIFTYRKWLQPLQPIDRPIAAVQDESIESEYDEEALLPMVKSMAVANGKDSGTANDFVWNGPVFAAINARTESPSYTLVESDYYTVKTSSEQLKEELYRSLYDRGVDADAQYLDIVDHINEIDTPLRDKYYQNFEDVLQFRDGPRLVGGSAVTVFNTGDEYVIPIATRSSMVSESPGWRNPLPAGVLQPPEDDTPEPSNDDFSVLEDHVLTEFYESFLENQDDDIEAFNQLESLLADEDAHMLYTASGIDCKQTYIQFYGLLFVDDPEYYQQYIADKDFSNWESEDVEMVSLSDEETLKELLSRHTMNPYNLLGFAESLFAMRDIFDVELPFPLDRT